MTSWNSPSNSGALERPFRLGSCFGRTLATIAVLLGVAALPVEAGNPTPPSNDDCANAISISEGVVGGTLIEATPDGSSLCDPTAGTPDVWYVVTAPGPGFLTLSTCGTHDPAGEIDEGIDTVISVFDACGGTLLACGDGDPLSLCAGDSGVLADAVVDIVMAAGESYWVRVSSADGATGTFTLTTTTEIAPTCPEPYDLLCLADCSSGDLTVTWTGTGFDVGYEVRVTAEDGALADVATGPGGVIDGTEVFTGLAAGRYTVEIFNTCFDGTVTFPIVCSVDVGQYAGQPNLIYRGESEGSIDSVDALTTALQANGEEFFVVSRLETFCLNSFVSTPNAILWVMLGTDFANSTSLSTADGLSLVDMLTGGVAIYVESSDMWGSHAPQPFFDYDGVAGLQADGNLMANGDAGLGSLSGGTHDQLDLADLTDVPHTLDPQQPNVSYDRLVPTGGGVGSGGDTGSVSAGLIWTESTQGYGLAVFNRTQADWGNVICQSWEIGSFGGAPTELVDRYRRALLELAPNFRRGDCNGDDNFDIADAITTLSFLFSGGVIACQDACDANDDGAIDIADAISKLDSLFAGGTPFGPCGADATPSDSLTCEVSPCP